MAKVHSQQSAVWQAREALPWWFPSQQAMKELIEGAGFNWIKGEGEVQLRQATLTENEKGGVEGWIRLFGEPFLELLPTIEARDAAIKHA
ncbi:S-adenosyl-L-methionine-dependent methyltransferase [Penicillium majusculum]|nr:S-adenosyl-L-methionine-dependent methyltransferase [Penicillium majusculum]